MRRVLATVLVLSLLAPAARAGERLRLATTTSTENSGLLAFLLPSFEAESGLAVDVIAVGSGKAMKIAEHGDVDVVLSHAPELEAAFLSAGFGVNRREVMFNDFVIVGPRGDPAEIRGLPSASKALERIAVSRAPFVSRGDESGTHQKEKALWTSVGVEPSGLWYHSAGQGMGAVLTIADEMAGYTIADRGTWLAYRAKGDLEVHVEGDPALFNPYTIIAVNPARHSHVKYRAAMSLIAWLTSPEGQRRIDGFRLAGDQLFHAVAVPMGATAASR